MLTALLAVAGWIAVAGWLECCEAIEMEDESIFPPCPPWIETETHSRTEQAR